MLNTPSRDEAPGVHSLTRRRRRILHLILLVCAVVTAVTMALLTLLLVAGTWASAAADMQRLLPVTGFVLTVIGLAYALSRLWRYEAGGILFLILLIVAFFLADDPRQLTAGRSLMFFALPILISAAILPPYAVLIATGAIAVALLSVSLWVIGEAPNIIGTMGLIALGSIAYFFADNLQRLVGTLARSLAEQQQAEEALRRSEATARALLNATFDSAFLMRPDGTILAANEAMGQRFGRSPRDLIGVDAFALIPPELAAQRKVWAEQALAMSQPVHFEDQRAGAYYENTFYPVRDAQGRVVSLAVFGRDITDRKRAEETLRASEERLRRENRAFMSLATSGAWLRSDLASAVRELTEMAADLMHVERVSVWWYSADRSRITCFDLYEHSPKRHSTGQELVAAEFPTYSASHAQGQVIAAMDVRTDPRTREIPAAYFDAADITSLLDAPVWQRGELVGLFSLEQVGTPRTWTPDEERLAVTMATLVALSRESDQRRRVEAALRESEERYRLISELTSDYAFSVRVEPDGRTVTEWAGGALERITGYTLTELEARGGWQTLVHPDDLPIFERRRMALVAGGSDSGEYRIINKQGEVRWLLNYGQGVWDADQGRVVRIIGATTDVSARHSLETQLLQAQKMEAVGRLAGGIAHDFNNLLTVINGYSQLALSTLGPEEAVRADLEQIYRAGQRATELTRQLLAFSRRQMLEPRVLDLNELLAGISRMLARLLGEDVRLELNLAPALGPVRADVGQIEQVVMNLAVNARDAMPQGGTLTLETVNVELEAAHSAEHAGLQPGSYVMLAVSDTGVGMSPEVQQHLFEPFFTTKEVGKGTGLGLAMVYGIVKQSGGEIYVHSEQGRGTTLKVYFPRTDAASVEDLSLAAAGLPQGNETILVVEDQTDVRQLAVRMLFNLGYNVLEASRGDEALALLANTTAPIHLLLTDVIMPEMDGRQFARRALVERPALKVLYMSGYPDRAIASLGVLAEGVPFIQKPFALETLAYRVRQALDHVESQ